MLRQLSLSYPLLLLLLFTSTHALLLRDISAEDALFLNSHFTFWLPSDLPPGVMLGAVSSSLTPWSSCLPDSLRYELLPSGNSSNLSFVELDPELGLLHLKSSWRPSQVSPGTKYDFFVQATCHTKNATDEANDTLTIVTSSLTSEVVATSLVTLEVTSGLAEVPQGEAHIRAACWSGPVDLAVPENTASLLLAAFRGDASMTLGDVNLTYSISGDEQTKSHFLLADNASLWLMRPLDREDNAKITAVVSCSTIGGNASSSLNLTLSVLDIDDNPPIFNKTGSQTLLIPMSKAEATAMLEVDLVDKDLTVAETYEIVVPSNYSQLITMPTLRVEGSSIKAELTINFSARIDWPREMRIGFRDKGYQSPSTSNQSRQDPKANLDVEPASWNDTAVLTLRIVDTSPRMMERHLSRAASKYTRLVTLLDVFGELSNFRLDDSTVEAWGKVFNLTPRMGILYVANKTAMDDLQVDNLTLTVLSQDSGFQVPIQVKVTVNGSRGRVAECHEGCGRVGHKELCKRSCGPGAMDGLCGWRLINHPKPDKGFWYGFESCTPTPQEGGHCPDLRCDELELMDPDNICPQDCAESVLSRGQINQDTKLGIKWGSPNNPCFCYANRICSCVPEELLRPISSPAAPAAAKGYGNSSQPGDDTAVKADLRPSSATTSTPQVSEMRQEGLAVCGQECWGILAVAVPCLLVTVGVVLWCIKRRRRRRRQNRWRADTIKDFNSLMSTSAVPSFYIEDRERFTSYASSPQASPKGPVLDSRWEFPRNCLLLEQSLGEGEFGRVVKAKAYGLNGKDLHTTVAIKMLKPDATRAELEDLKSEFNLLKEVNHPNVIRLLGVCTIEGPFYIIVEYCRYGCLRSFLRKSKSRELQNWEEKGRLNHSTPSQQPRIMLTLRDMLSFAWQVTRGMEYLSNMKVVHRDLAARNILVADGKQLKISDFGLSRDVYVADVYFKLSKGRMPVKWMAPESLYEQTYTTKSDTWSFGITLWEIVTMGANPYPGIMPERLFTLLKQGYRMDKPENCPDEIYAIMQKCWKQEAEQRPSFSDLVQMLDNMLQQNQNYLDLVTEPTYLDSQDLCTDGEQSWRDPEDGYGSINMLRTNRDDYLIATPATDSSTDEEDEKEDLLAEERV